MDTCKYFVAQEISPCPVHLQAFVTNPLGEVDVNTQTEHGILINGPNGTKLVSIASQTAEVCLQEDGAAVTNQNLTSLYHGGWPLSGGELQSNNVWFSCVCYVAFLICDTSLE